MTPFEAGNCDIDLNDLRRVEAAYTVEGQTWWFHRTSWLGTARLQRDDGRVIGGSTPPAVWTSGGDQPDDSFGVVAAAASGPWLGVLFRGYPTDPSGLTFVLLDGVTGHAVAAQSVNPALGQMAAGLDGYFLLAGGGVDPVSITWDPAALELTQSEPSAASPADPQLPLDGGDRIVVESSRVSRVSSTGTVWTRIDSELADRSIVPILGIRDGALVVIRRPWVSFYHTPFVIHGSVVDLETGVERCRW